LTGFVIYDRRTTFAPVESKAESILIALNEASENDPAFHEALIRTVLYKTTLKAIQKKAT